MVGGRGVVHACVDKVQREGAVQGHAELQHRRDRSCDVVDIDYMMALCRVVID